MHLKMAKKERQKMLELQSILYKLPSILLAISLHEYAHARTAKVFGDLSAVLLGRATLNPLMHLDPFGTICLILFNFGWARPVPINPMNFSNRKLGLLGVSLAGPISNLALALILGQIVQLVSPMPLWLFKLLFYGMLINIGLGLFNLIPLPPLDGFHVVESLFERSRLVTWLNSFGPLLLITIIVLDNFANTGIISSILIKPMYKLMILFGGKGIFAPLFR
jgi:Zn-dependent protease